VSAQVYYSALSLCFQLATRRFANRISTRQMRYLCAAIYCRSLIVNPVAYIYSLQLLPRIESRRVTIYLLANDIDVCDRIYD